ncbi:multidrug resistance protein [Hyphodiscus hymeniophilus]|uniref:Multidrug resistance protein n=1 Tax=Hyphodiscus hymeniophilus TaxID=353542 RepID=A0A9P7AWK7_9HELO|nr:multidrug resistance protein [Hyphodiscus hymeniophilus]
MMSTIDASMSAATQEVMENERSKGSSSDQTRTSTLSQTNGDDGAEEPQDAKKEVSTLRLVFILGGLWFGMLIVVMDDTMMGTISGPVSASFNSLSKLSWIQTLFPIGASIAQPLSGHLTDIYGRRKGLMVCYTLFAIGTLLCGLAPVLGVFLLGRIFQGMGGGAIVSITAFIETDLVPLRKRAFIEGLGNICYGIVFALGGVYGGEVNEAIGWRWAFLIQPPIVVMNGLLVFFVVKIRQKQTEASLLHQIDYFGGFTLVVAIIFFQLALNSGGNTAGWGSALVISSLVISGISFGMFIFWDFCKASNPAIPLRAMLLRTVAASQLSFFFASAANISVLFYVPIYLQVLGYSTGAAGLRFIPMAVGIAASSAITGRIVEVSGRFFWINVPVQICYILGVALLCSMTQHTPPWCIFVYVGIFGIGYGGAFVTRLMGVLSSVQDEKQAIIQAASWTIESTGLALGITIASTVFQKLSLGRLRTLLEGNPALLNKVSADIESLKTLHGSQKQAIIGIYLKAVRGVFFLTLAEILLAAMMSLLMKNNKLVDEPKEAEGIEGLETDLKAPHVAETHITEEKPAHTLA